MAIVCIDFELPLTEKGEEEIDKIKIELKKCFCKLKLAKLIKRQLGEVNVYKLIG